MEDLSLHILDVAENSFNAGATLIKISIAEDTACDLMTVTIEDNGSGMSGEFVQRVLDPFCTTRTTRRVGLGLSLLAQSARETGGDIRIESVPGKGTIISAYFRTSHIDMKPLGNLADTITTLIAGNVQADIDFSYSLDGGTHHLDTRGIRAALEEVPINSAEVLSVIRSDLNEGLQDLQKQRTMPARSEGNSIVPL